MSLPTERNSFEKQVQRINKSQSDDFYLTQENA